MFGVQVVPCANSTGIWQCFHFVLLDIHLILTAKEEEMCNSKNYRGGSPKIESFISGSVWGTESNGEGPRCMR